MVAVNRSCVVIGSLCALVLGAIPGCGGATRGDDLGGKTAGTGGASSSSGGASTGGRKPAAGGNAAAGGRPAAGGVSGRGGASSTGGVSPYLYAKEFDQGCAEASNCYAVSEGAQCDCDLCPNAAINVGDVPLWREGSVHSLCGPIGCNPTACVEMVAACIDSWCQVVPAPVIEESDYERDCRSDSDCVLLPTGPWCSGCSCSMGAVNKSGYLAYQEQVKDLACRVDGPLCECATPSKAICVPQPDGPDSFCEASY